jgi:hypothetical protein
MEIFLGAFTSEWEARKAAFLLERAKLSKRKGVDEEIDEAFSLRVKSAGAAEPVSFGNGRQGSRAFRAKRELAASARSMEQRFAGLASGSQPAVVKMASYGGAARIGAMVEYVSREGELSVENERGEQIAGREDLARIRGDWDHLVSNRAESRDIGNFTLAVGRLLDGVDAEARHERVRDILSSGLADRSYAYAIEEDARGRFAVSGVVVLRSGQGERLTGDTKAAGIVQERMAQADSGAFAGAAFAFQGHGNGVDYGTAKVRALVEKNAGEVYSDKGERVGDAERAGALVQKNWRGELHSRKSREVMHLIVSARAGTDSEAFRLATREFLAEQFGNAGHRYVFALHDPEHDPKDADAGGKRPHVHAHAIVTMKSEFGDRISTSPDVFRQWRETLAEKAREQGIAMEMSDRRELASPPAFGKNQVRPVDRSGRTEHVGTSLPAQKRYEAKRAGRVVHARSERSRVYTILAKQTWIEVAKASGDHSARSYALEQTNRLELAPIENVRHETADIVRPEFGSKFRANMVTLKELMKEGADMAEMNRQQFESYEKKIETALFNFERSIDADQRQDFEEIAMAAREVVDVRREQLQLREEQSNERDTGRDGDPNAQWDAAVAKHGLETVEQGNEALLNVEMASMAIDQAEMNGRDPKTAQKEYERELARAAELAAAGNSYVREVADRNEDLAKAIERAESETTSKGKDGVPVEAAMTEGHDRDEPDDRAEVERAERETHALHEQAEALSKRENRVERTSSERAREDARADPAQQRIPRQDEIQRQRNDRDDYER